MSTKRICSLLMALLLLLNIAAPAVPARAETATEFVELTISADHAKIVDPDGNEIPGGTLEKGTQLAFSVQPEEGYDLITLVIGTNTLIVDSEDTIQITLNSDTTLSATAQQKAFHVTRSSLGYVDSATYTIVLREDVTLASATVTDNASVTTDIAQNTEGTYTFSVTANGTYTVAATDTDGNGYSQVINETAIDKEAPVLADLTRTESGMVKAATYTFTATDDMGIASVVVRSENGTVNHTLYPDANGLYSFQLSENGTFTVTATDVAGKQAQLSGDETEVYPKAPVISEISRQTQSWAKQAEYQFTATDPDGLESVTVTCGGEPVAVTEENGTYSFVADRNAAYTVTVTDTESNASGKTVTESKLDLNGPAISVTRENEEWLAAAQYTYTVTDAESGVQSIRITVDGATSEVAVSAAGTYTLTLDGNKTVTIQATDALGNVSGCTVTESKIDIAGPVISQPTRENADWTNASANYSFTVTDDGSGVKAVTLKIGEGEATTLLPNSNGAYTFALNENTSFVITATDNLGFESSLSGAEEKIDKGAPTVTSITRVPQGWQQSAEITVKVADALSGIASVTASVDGTPVQVEKAEENTYSFTADINGTYKIVVTDNAGNTYSTNVFESYIDTVAPVISTPVRTESGWAQTATYTFSVEETASGMQTVTVSVSGTEKELTANNSGVYQFTLDSNASVTVTATDIAGNSASVSVTETQIDTDKPAIQNLARAESGWATSATYSFSVADADSSVVSVTLQIGEDTPAELTADSNGIYTFTLTANRDYKVVVTDAAGNTEAYSGTEKQIDTGLPVIGSIDRITSGWAQSTDYQIVAEDSLSGIASVTYRFEDGAENAVVPNANGAYVFTVAENGKYTVAVTDKAGNSASMDVTETEIDLILPIISTPVRQTQGWAQGSAWSFGVSDGDSDVASVTATVDGKTVTLTPDASGSCAVDLTGNQTVQITVTDVAGNVQTASFEETQVDTTKPGTSQIKRTQTGWQQSSDYTFTVSDDLSGVAEVSVTIGSEVPAILIPDKDGIYTFHMGANGSFTVSVTDNAGNVHTVSGEESQVDTTAPVIHAFDRITSGWSYTADYKIVAEDALAGIQSVTVQFEGGKLSSLVADSNGDYTFTAAENGKYTVTVTDLAGNVASSEVTEDKIDQTKPEISTPVRKEAATWVQESTWTFTVSDPASEVASVMATVNGQNVPVTPDENGTCTIYLTRNQTVTVTVKDTVGNTQTAIFTESLVDTTKPAEVDLTRKQLSWNPYADYQFKAEDNASGIASVTVRYEQAQAKTLTPDANGLYTFRAEENGTYTLTLTDVAGNVHTVTVAEEKVDYTDPTIDAIEREDLDWRFHATYTISAGDNLSGIQSITYRFENGGENNVSVDAEGNVTFVATENGTYTVTVTDKAGNVTTASVTEEKLDQQAPVITYDRRNNPTWSQDAVHTFTVVDNAPTSGVQSVTVKLGDQEIPVTTDAEDPTLYSFRIAENGSYTITATDNVGNSITLSVTEDHIDLAAPVISDIFPQTEWDADTNTVVIHASDESELASVTAADADGKDYPVTDNGDGTFQFVADHNGAYTVTATDTAGNSISLSCTVNRIDTESPSVPVLTDTANELWINKDVTVLASSDDLQSGVASYWFSADKESWTQMVLEEGIGKHTFTEEQDSVYYIIAMDGVGRVSEPAEVRVAIDKTVPTDLSLTYEEDEGSGYRRTVNGIRIYNDKVTFSMKAADPASGIAAYEFLAITSAGETAWIKVDGTEAGVTRSVMFPDDTISICMKVWDIAGNCTESFTNLSGEEPVKVILENTPAEDTDRAKKPVIAPTVGEQVYAGNWTSSDVTLSVSGSAAVSGIEYYQWRMIPADEKIPATDWATVPVKDGVAQITVSEDTNAVFQFRAVTYAGNASQVAETVVKVRKTAPEAPVILPDVPTGTNNWYTVLPGYEIRLPAVDPYAAQMHYEISYSHDGEEQPIIAYDGTNAPAISEDGVWIITVTAIDEAGNRTSSKPVTFLVDTKVPDKLDVLLNGSSILNVAEGKAEHDKKVNIIDRTASSDFSIFLNAPAKITASADGGDSGIAAIYYMVVTESGKFSVDGTWTLLPADGLEIRPDSKNCLYFKAVDVAGNITYFSGTSVLMDSKAPADIGLTVLDTNKTNHGYYYGDVTVDVRVEEPVSDGNVFSGLQSVTYRVLANGRTTQQGSFAFDGDSTEKSENRIRAWGGQINVSSALNDSNFVVVEVTATDMAGNVRTTATKLGDIKIDMTKPKITASYQGNKPVAEAGGKAYFTGSRTLTVVVDELNFVPGESHVFVTDNDTGRTETYDWSTEGNVHTAVIQITKDGHYTVAASVTDAGGNNTTYIAYADGSVAPGAFVIDNTKPTVTVTYDNNLAINGFFFDAPRTATVTVTERNFDPTKFVPNVDLIADGAGGWNAGNWVSDGSKHTLTVHFNGDGQYTFAISGSDILGNTATETVYNGTAAQSWVIDQTISKPQFSGVTANSAYAGDVIPVITFLDTNLETTSVKLYRTRMNAISEDVTGEMLTGTHLYEDIQNGKRLTLDVFPEEEKYDGIYTLTATMTDKAGNTETASVTFSVNRFGSTYQYGEDLLNANGKVLYSLGTDLTITEINPTKLVANSAVIQITRDGTPIADPIFTVNPVLDGSEKPADHGWYEYRYVISRENFTEDGIYTVVLSTKDAAGNVPENTAEEYVIRFAVDTTAPELTSVIGLEEAIVKADAQKVTFDAIDNIGLSSIVIYVDGEQVAQWEDLDGYSLSESFDIPAGLERHVRIVITDMAGNVLDTDAEGFAPGYAWQDITVSTNGFLRWYANKPLFIGSLVVTFGSAGAGTYFAFGKKRKKEEIPQQ